MDTARIKLQRAAGGAAVAQKLENTIQPAATTDSASQPAASRPGHRRRRHADLGLNSR